VRLDSVLGLKQQLLTALIEPLAEATRRIRREGARAMKSTLARKGLDAHDTVFGVGARPFDTLPNLQRSVALGVSRGKRDTYRLAVRVQRASLLGGPVIEAVTRQAKGEVEVRLIGRVDKRATTTRRRTASQAPWYQRNCRPLLIGASVGHEGVTAGTLGAFVMRGEQVHLLSNNHVLANEDRGKRHDWILQRARFDGGKQPADRIARLSYWVRFKKNGTNFVDAAMAALEEGLTHDAARLRELINGADKTLKGVANSPIDEGERVYKLGRTTGPRAGRVTAFELDNVVVNYDAGNLRFDGQIEIEGAGTKGFSDGGDSGALVVNARMEAVALLFAGGESGGANGLGLTYANPIDRVLSDLRATLLF